MKGFEIGVTEVTNDMVYVDLRLGKITQSSKTSRDGFAPAVTRNNAGDEYHFFAKTFENLTGYVKELRWYQNTLDNGTILKGWKMTLDVGEECDYVFDLGDKQRPFNGFMSRLVNVDFTQPLRLSGYLNKNGKKVLKITQGCDDAGKEIWVEPYFPARYLSRIIIDKLKAKEELTPDEERNIARSEDGKILGQMRYDELDGAFTEGYPYIFQNASDGTWNYSVYTAFLIDYTKEKTIPRLAEEIGGQPVIQRRVAAERDEGAGDLPAFSGGDPEEDFHYSGPPPAVPDGYDDGSAIPF